MLITIKICNLRGQQEASSVRNWRVQSIVMEVVMKQVRRWKDSKMENKNTRRIAIIILKVKRKYWGRTSWLKKWTWYKIRMVSQNSWLLFNGELGKKIKRKKKQARIFKRWILPNNNNGNNPFLGVHDMSLLCVMNLLFCWFFWDSHDSLKLLFSGEWIGRKLVCSHCVGGGGTMRIGEWAEREEEVAWLTEREKEREMAKSMAILTLVTGWWGRSITRIKMTKACRHKIFA